MLHKDFHIALPYADTDEIAMFFPPQHTFVALTAVVGSGGFDELAGIAE